MVIIFIELMSTNLHIEQHVEAIRTVQFVDISVAQSVKEVEQELSREVDLVESLILNSGLEKKFVDVMVGKNQVKVIY